jgi:NTE family protein
MTEESRRPRVGLVLGAGGVRGCAHAGAIEVLRDANIPIDLVVGASVGSIFGLGVAADWPTERIAQAALQMTPLRLFRFYAGRLRCDARNPGARMVMEAGGGKDFGDLPVRFAVVGTDMETNSSAVIDEGPVIKAIEASIALPMISKPVAIQGRFFVDGGLMDTIPIHVARSMGAEVVIAVCLGVNYTAPKILRAHPWSRSIFESLGRQRGEFTGSFRDQMIFTSRLFAAAYNPPLPRDDADVAIWPEFGNIGTNSLFGSTFCFHQGAKAARAALPRIREVLDGKSPVAASLTQETSTAGLEESV